MNYKIVKLQELQGDGFLNRKYLENKNLSEKSYKEQHKFFLELIVYILFVVFPFNFIRSHFFNMVSCTFVKSRIYH